MHLTSIDMDVILTQLRDYVAANVGELASLGSLETVKLRPIAILRRHGSICPEARRFARFLCFKKKHFTDAQRKHCEESLAIMENIEQ